MTIDRFNALAREAAWLVQCRHNLDDAQFQVVGSMSPDGVPDVSAVVVKIAKAGAIWLDHYPASQIAGLLTGSESLARLRVLVHLDRLVLKYVGMS